MHRPSGGALAYNCRRLVRGLGALLGSSEKTPDAAFIGELIGSSQVLSQGCRCPFRLRQDGGDSARSTCSHTPRLAHRLREFSLYALAQIVSPKTIAVAFSVGANVTIEP